MKKLLQFISVVTLLCSTVESKAQLADGNLAPDFTFTDIAGNTQHLYALLDSGYTTYIDISAAWCVPCWGYHTSGALEGLYNTYGPHGTNVLRVLFVEGELTNTINQLNGSINTGGYAGSTQGDWVTGTPYPMIDLSNSTPGATTFLGSAGYQIAYFPTVYMICPDRTITLVGQGTTSQLYAAKASCSIAVAADDAQLMAPITLGAINANLQSCDSVNPTFRLGNIGSAPLTSATITYQVDGVTQKVKNWTGNLAPYNNVNVTNVKLGAAIAGGHTITATVSNPNGGTDPTAANNVGTSAFVKYSTTVSPMISETFETSGIPTNWVISNGGDPTTWTNASVGFNSTKSARLSFFNIPSGDVDFFAFDPMSFVGATAVQLTFDVSYAQATSTSSDKLEVDISTNCGVSWTPRYVKSGSTLSTNGTSYVTSQYTPTLASQWRHETVNFPSLYFGQPDVLVRIKGTSAQGNNVYVDNINFNMTTGIDEVENISEINIYPNPAISSTNINFNLTQSSSVSITVTNELGQELVKTELGNLSTGVQNYVLNTEKLSRGLYFVSIKTEKGTVTKKLSVNK